MRSRFAACHVFHAAFSVLALVVAAAALSAAPAAASHSHAPSPGAVGIGDPLFPTLGNGGYDARHYSLGLRYADGRAAADGQRHA